MSDLKEEMSEEEREGVKAIQFLLSLTGDKEPEWISLRNWRMFSETEKQTTMEIYNLFKEGQKEIECLNST